MPEDSKPAVTQALRAAILAGEYAPTQRLVEIDLCDRFGTSRFILRSSPCRIWQHRVWSSSSATAARGYGTSLLPRRSRSPRSVSSSRALVAARAADRVTKPEAAMLRKIVKDMRTAVDRSELLTYSDLNALLHGSIRDIAAHATASRMLRQLRDQTVRHQFSLSLVPGRPAVSLPQHVAIVAAIIARRSPRRLSGQCRRHLYSVIEAFRALSVAVMPR